MLGAVSLVISAVASMAAPDVKGALARSTGAQMGFMVLCCGLGWFTAAALHLVAHGMYKASLFLGSGGTVDRHAAERESPPPVRSVPGRLALAVVPAVVAVVLVARALRPMGQQQAVIAGLVALAAACVLFAWVGRLASTSARVLTAVGVAVLAAGYVAAAHALVSFLGSSVAATGVEPASPLLLLPLLAVAAAASMAARTRTPRWSGLRTRLYVAAISFGDPASSAVRLAGVMR